MHGLPHYLELNNIKQTNSSPFIFALLWFKPLALHVADSHTVTELHQNILFTIFQFNILSLNKPTLTWMVKTSYFFPNILKKCLDICIGKLATGFIEISVHRRVWYFSIWVSRRWSSIENFSHSLPWARS